MDARELRYGNFAMCERCDGTKVETQAFELKASGKWLSRIGLPITDPIPLTEEWLTRFGFEKEPLTYSINIDIFGGGKKLAFSGDYLYIIDSEKNNTIPTDIITLWNKDLRKAFYVHQLQNLYFALTGAELELKDNAKEN